MTETRRERDSMGEVEVPAEALYGAQTQRAIDNFPISGRRLPERFIRALTLIKSAAASANIALGELDDAIGEAIVQAASQLLADPELLQHFPVDVFQTGSGTSTNMNANEVLANLASRISGLEVHPNDHVNRGQSSNDVIPSAIHVSATLALQDRLQPALRHLTDTTRDRAEQLHTVVKTGRTHLMDAMPVRMSQCLQAWADQVADASTRLDAQGPELRALALGGTAVGTGINTHPDFAPRCCEALGQLCGTTFHPADNFFTRIGSQDTVLALSGQLRGTGITLMKIANDLRWMNSGPLAGLGEIELEALQPGSSIMPGKVNPVIPEAVAMVGAQVMGNDATIAVACQSGNFELNVMLPVIAERLLDSIQLLANASRLLADKAIASFVVKEEQLEQPLARNPILVTALNPMIGYQAAAAIAKQAYAEGRPIIDVAAEHTDIAREHLEELLDPGRLADGGQS
jgi:fumarate hydratase class II